MRLILAGALSFLLIVTATAATTRAADDQPKGKILMVLYFDKNCHAWCDAVRPIVSELAKKYADKVDVVFLDVTQNVLPEAKKRAKELGVQRYIADVINSVPLVGIYTSSRKQITELTGKKPGKSYEEELIKAIAKEGG